MKDRDIPPSGSQNVVKPHFATPRVEYPYLSYPHIKVLIITFLAMRYKYQLSKSVIFHFPVF